MNRELEVAGVEPADLLRVVRDWNHAPDSRGSSARRGKGFPRELVRDRNHAPAAFFLASVVPFGVLASAFRERGFDDLILCRIESLPWENGQRSMVNGKWLMRAHLPRAGTAPCLAIIPPLSCSLRQAEVEPQAFFRRAEALNRRSATAGSSFDGSADGRCLASNELEAHENRHWLEANTTEYWLEANTTVMSAARFSPDAAVVFALTEPGALVLGTGGGFVATSVFFERRLRGGRKQKIKTRAGSLLAI